MLTKDDFETAARKYCELMGLDADEMIPSESPEGEPCEIARLHYAIQAGRAHLAWQVAFQHALNHRAEASPPPNTAENRLSNIVTP